MQISKIFIYKLSLASNYNETEIEKLENDTKQLLSTLKKLANIAKECEDYLVVFYENQVFKKIWENLQTWKELLNPDNFQKTEKNAFLEFLKHFKDCKDEDNTLEESNMLYYEIDFFQNNLLPINNTALAEATEYKLKQNPNILVVNVEIDQHSEDFVGVIKKKYQSSFKNPPTTIYLNQTDNTTNIKEWVKLYAEWYFIINDDEVFEKFCENTKNKTIDFANKISNWNITKLSDIFPFSDFSNAFLEAYTQKHKKKPYSSQLFAGNASEAQELLEKVARINGWKKNQKLTKENNRWIFEPKYPANGTIKYIATDTQHIDFECHSNSSTKNHQGSISANGNSTKNAQGHELKF